MKKLIVAIIAITAVTTSCSVLHSNTTIKPNDSFILGNNQHGAFKVELKNFSKNELEVYQAPVDGGKHSSQNVQPGERINVSVDKNTALIIVNKSSDTANAALKVSGDTGLSMGYKNQ